MNKRIIFVVLVILVLFVTIMYGFNSEENEQEIVNVSAAASLQGALTEIEQKYENNENKVDITYGGSGTLVTQIQEGAPADIFISASIDNFENLKSTNDISEEVNLLRNNLVVIASKDVEIKDVMDVDVIAIGTPEVVPAGTYAVQALESLGVYDNIKEKLVQTKDVSEVVTYVETGNAQMGIVYSSDTTNLQNSKVIYEFDEKSHDEIIYPMASLNDEETTNDFYDFLQTDDAIEIFEKYGFEHYE